MRFLGIGVSVWVGGSVANVKQPQAVLPTKNPALTLLPASPRPIFRPFCSEPLASDVTIGQRRGGLQWRLTELNELIVSSSRCRPRSQQNWCP